MKHWDYKVYVLCLQAWVSLLDFGSNFEFYCLINNALQLLLYKKWEVELLSLPFPPPFLTSMNKHKIFNCNEENMELYEVNHKQFISRLLDM